MVASSPAPQTRGSLSLGFRGSKRGGAPEVVVRQTRHDAPPSSPREPVSVHNSSMAVGAQQGTDQIRSALDTLLKELEAEHPAAFVKGPECVQGVSAAAQISHYINATILLEQWDKGLQ